MLKKEKKAYMPITKHLKKNAQPFFSLRSMDIKTSYVKDTWYIFFI